MQNHIEDLRLIAESINRELNYNSINKHETKRDIEMIIDGILPCLLRNCDELGIMDHVKSMIKIIEDYKKWIPYGRKDITSMEVNHAYINKKNKWIYCIK